jgi:dihydrofolate synthase/folylpolyglutamate synthase
MSYPKTIAYLFGLQRFGIKLGLSNITTILQHLGNPHEKLRCIHIAGSNGKGSTAIILLSILKRSGYRVGLFTSPHLINFTERIRINDSEIPKKRVVLLVEEIKDLCDRISLKNVTYFEVVTAMALKYFKEEKADPVILEVGMGGRLDATNVVHSILSIITSISLEHQIYLGNTLLKIAGEKAGIIKKNTPLITGAKQNHVLQLFSRQCKKMHAPMYRIGKQILGRRTGMQTFNYQGLKTSLRGLELSLMGDHQISNATMAIAAAEVLDGMGFSLATCTIREGLKNVQWPGRLEIVRDNPPVLLDGAHNPAAWKALKKSLTNYFHFNKLFIILGVMEDKDIDQLITILTPEAYKTIFCRPKMLRSATKEIIGKYIAFSSARRVAWMEDTPMALEMVFREALPEDLICVTGSLFTVGEAREYLLPPRGRPTGRIAM